MPYTVNGDSGRKPKMTKAKKPAKKPAGKSALKGLKPGSPEFMRKLRSLKKK